MMGGFDLVVDGIGIGIGIGIEVGIWMVVAIAFVGVGGMIGTLGVSTGTVQDGIVIGSMVCRRRSSSKRRTFRIRIRIWIGRILFSPILDEFVLERSASGRVSIRSSIRSGSNCRTCVRRRRILFVFVLGRIVHFISFASEKFEKAFSSTFATSIIRTIVIAIAISTPMSIHASAQSQCILFGFVEWKAMGAAVIGMVGVDVLGVEGDDEYLGRKECHFFLHGLML